MELQSLETLPSLKKLPMSPSEDSGNVISIADQLQEDLNIALKKFKDPKKGLRILARKMEIHEKTLVRLLANQNKAGYITLYKIYRVLTEAKNDTELLDLVPECIRSHLISYNPKKTNEGIVFSSDIENEINKDSVFMELFFICGAGETSLKEISSRFGTYGVEVLKKMVKLGVLKETTPQKYIIGNQQANLSPNLIKRAGLHLTESHLDESLAEIRGHNFVGIYAEGLSEATYQEWLKIDEEAYNKKVALANQENGKGDKRAFTFVATDTFKFIK